MDAETCIFCPVGETQCPWLDEARRNFERGVHGGAMPEFYQERKTRAFDTYGRPLDPEFTRIEERE